MKRTRTPLPRRRGKRTQVAGLRVLGHNQPWLFRRLFRGCSEITIGRTNTQGIRLRDETVSKEHATIVKYGRGQYIIRDSKPSSGVYISRYGEYSDFVRVDEYFLEFGIHIQIGEVILTPVDSKGEAPVLVKNVKELAQASRRLYGSYREAQHHVKIERRALSKHAGD